MWLCCMQSCNQIKSNLLFLNIIFIYIKTNIVFMCHLYLFIIYRPSLHTTNWLGKFTNFAICGGHHLGFLAVSLKANEAKRMMGRQGLMVKEVTLLQPTNFLQLKNYFVATLLWNGPFLPSVINVPLHRVVHTMTSNSRLLLHCEVIWMVRYNI